MTSGMLTPTTFEGAIQFSDTLSKSTMVPKNFQNKPEDILVAVQWGSEVGLPPLQALQNIAVINGKPAIYGDAALALVTGHPEYGGHEEVIDRPDGDIVAVCRITRIVKGEKVVTERTFSQGDAQRAGLWNKAGPWKQYPKRMLQMRARGFAIRDAFPDALKGVSVVEEQQDVPMKDVTPVNPLDQILSPEPQKTAFTEAHTEALEPVNEPAVQTKPDPSPEASEAPTEKIDVFKVKITLLDGEILYLDGWGDFYGTFIQEINAISDDTERSYKQRRHDISEFKKMNDQMVNMMAEQEPDNHEALGDGYKKLIRYLSAKAKEAGEK